MLSRRAAMLLAMLALGVYLWRTGPGVWDFLARTPGDFGYNFEAGARLVAGESPFHPGFAYPPAVPLLYAALVPLGLHGARIAWYALSQAALLAAALALLRPAGGDAAALAAVALLWGLGGTFAENLALGQMNPLLLLLIALALRGLAPAGAPQGIEAPPRLDRAAAAFSGAAALGSAAALGVAAALKIWPGLLLLPWLRRGRWRGLALGVGIAALSTAVPLAAYRAFLPPPHRSAATGFWMGTPALLNFSLPAAALRATYRWESQEPVPADWERGIHPAALRLAPYRRHVAVAISLVTLAAGLAALGLRASWTAARGTRSAPRDDRLGLGYLAGLAVVASPISWYHYQLFLLPGGVLLAAAYLRRGRLLPLGVLFAALLAAGWAHRGIQAGLILGGIPVSRFLFGAGLAVPFLDLIVLGLLLAEIGREPAFPARC